MWGSVRRFLARKLCEEAQGQSYGGPNKIFRPQTPFEMHHHGLKFLRGKEVCADSCRTDAGMRKCDELSSCRSSIILTAVHYTILVNHYYYY